MSHASTGDLIAWRMRAVGLDASSTAIDATDEVAILGGSDCSRETVSARRKDLPGAKPSK